MVKYEIQRKLEWGRSTCCICCIVALLSHIFMKALEIRSWTFPYFWFLLLQGYLPAWIYFHLCHIWGGKKKNSFIAFQVYTVFQNYFEIRIRLLLLEVTSNQFYDSIFLDHSVMKKFIFCKSIASAIRTCVPWWVFG